MVLTSELKQELLERAAEARRWAYAPYSNYPVGAALLAESGKIYTGVNVENVAYPHTVCAERVAVFKAVSEGERHFTAIAVVTVNAKVPCGGCRQVLAEFGLDTHVLVGDPDGNLITQAVLRDLLPDAFTPADLPRR
ncbi:MAG: cytidine deaminase [Anaerolineales bacterium]